GTVLAYETDHFVRADLKIGGVQGGDTRKALGNFFEFNNRLLHLMVLVLLRRLQPVTATAITITTPWTERCTYGSTPERISPLASTVMIRAPMSVLSTPPRPPVRRVPPTTTAAILVNICPLPMSTSPTPSRDAAMAPASPAVAPEMTNARVLYRAIGMPDSAAISSEPPMT